MSKQNQPKPKFIKNEKINLNIKKEKILVDKAVLG